jgi:hypothetical protein
VLRNQPSSILAVIVSVLGALALPARARAADPAEVEELIRQGVELRRANKDHAAVPLFQRAYDLERSARTAAQLGLVESSLGYWLAAERHLNEALSFPRHPWLLRNKAEIDKALRDVQSYIGEVAVTGAPAGAEVLLNGRAVGRLPLPEPLRLAEGPAVVEVRAPGYLPSTTNLKIDGGRRESLNIALQPGSGAAAGPGTPPGTGAHARAPTSPETTAARQVDAGAGPPRAWLRPVSFGVAAVAAGALAVGTYAVVDQRSLSRKFTQQACNTMANDKGGPACQDLYEDARARERLALVGFVSGGVLAAGAVVGLLLASGRDDAPSRYDVGWSVGAGSCGASAAVNVSF